MTTKCFTAPEFKIELLQDGPENFTVVYWKQVERNLTYSEAANRLGAAIMHAAACDGLLDNSELADE